MLKKAIQSEENLRKNKKNLMISFLKLTYFMKNSWRKQEARSILRGVKEKQTTYSRP